MTLRRKLSVLAAAITVLAVIAVAAVLHAVHRTDRKNRPRPGGPAVAAGPVSLGTTAEPLLMFRNLAWGPHRDELATVRAADPDGARTASGVKCLRFHAAAGTGICLRAEHGTLRENYRAVVLDAGLHERATYALPGIPSRARVSPSGALVAWTVFVGGDSYAGADFSTRTGILDLRDGKLITSLEDFTVIRDGADRSAPADANFWGVTFADDRVFYATMATGGHTHLVRGDLRERTVTSVHTNVECPSLSPDGATIVYKKRVEGASADAPWRLYALDPRSMAETALAESRSVDDQVVWSDPHTVVYALPGDYGADLYALPADGSGAPRRLTTAAVAPAYLG
ncbi:TolB family protein [Embleya hyalina]|uniref:TolB-like translocation protein signal peptide n=1 Tax=Embleya hyalina TaxID=516124 RepID=A0A401YZV4_9ACTN|nr:TolB-like translocation protein [Embleya hyalina]GCE00137.1 TolB-like translocation protein; signal peptide [Embleya hyalina]